VLQRYSLTKIAYFANQLNIVKSTGENTESHSICIDLHLENVSMMKWAVFPGRSSDIPMKTPAGARALETDSVVY